MCHKSVHDFSHKLERVDVKGRRVLEVGSYDVNGSVRPYIECLGCGEYVGIDMRPGKGVDLVCEAKNLVKEFSPESFGMVVCCEMLEHAENWKIAILNMKRVLKPDGLIMLTTRSFGFPRHEFPGDFWRFEVEDMGRIFADFDIVQLEHDPEQAGVFLLAWKPPGEYETVDLSKLEVCHVG